MNELFNWSETWLLKFHPDKCKMLPIYNKNKAYGENTYTMGTYDGGTTVLDNVESEKDIGVTIRRNLTFEKHIQTQINKANQILGLMRRAFSHLDNRTFSLLFKALVRPHLKYASSAWSPYKKKDINSIENVQRRATRMLPQNEKSRVWRKVKKIEIAYIEI
jgi:hypothetical protein